MSKFRPFTRAHPMNATFQSASRQLKLLTALASLGLVAACGGGGGEGGERATRLSAEKQGGAPEINVLSTRADLVSGGDALVELKLPKPTDAKGVQVTLNGANVSAQFAMRPNGRYQGLVTGLREGTNELVASVSIGASQHAATLTVTNYSKQGPIISGPQVEPYICQTELFGLGTSSPPKCEAPTKYEFFYKPVGSSATDPFKVYDANSPPAASEIASTTTDEGKTVPFIVRRERGVINRGVYDIAVLQQPGEERQPWGPRGAWNGKLLMIFNGATKPWHNQSLSGSIPDVLAVAHAYAPGTTHTGGDIPLARGFAVASSTISQVNNPVTSTETAMMVKEHLIETYGPVRYTIGVGCSGGSMMQHLTANNYPGLLDGLIPQCPLPDMWTAIMGHAAFDYPQLVRYFSQTSPQLWPKRSDRLAVYGGADAESSPYTSSGMLLPFWYGPRVGCTSESPLPQWVYDPVNNPGGARCALQDFQAQILGLRPPSAWGPIETQLGRGFANSPVDNIGVQYGLAALLRGEISPEQFVDLNLKVGGADIDGNWTAQRKEATREGLANLYRSGQVNDASRLDRVPMVIATTYAPLDLFHPLVAIEMVRARLMAANGHAKNLVQLITVDDQVGFPPTGGSGYNPLGTARSNPMKRAAFLAVDKWLAGIEADRSSAPLEVKVLRHKPAEAQDSCWADGKPGAKCPDAYRYPKMVAGAPVASDIMKCQLKPIDWSDYGSVSFTQDQQQRLQQAFPQGVCDWSKPGVEQQPPVAPWLTFARRVGGEPLGPEPTSTPVVGRR
jgi:hypothetical protein